MVTRSKSKLAAIAGGLALSALAGAGIASADELCPAAINTTCNYNQVVRGAGMRSRREPGRSCTVQAIASGFLQRYLASRAAARSDGPASRAQFPTQANKYLPMSTRSPPPATISDASH